MYMYVLSLLQHNYCTLNPAYRFFPLMMLFCVVLVSVLGRDFGPMLTAERNATPAPSHKRHVDEEQPTVMKAHSLNTAVEPSEDSYSGEYITHSVRSTCMCILQRQYNRFNRVTYNSFSRLHS